jgi:hypothetical protein
MSPQNPGQDLVHDQMLIRMALSVRMAWNCRRLRIRARPELLDELSEHVLLSLPEPMNLAEMELFADFCFTDLLDRVRLGRYRGPQGDAVSKLQISDGWRRSIEAACDPVALAVFHLRYSDGLHPETVARAADLDISEVQAAIEGLREIMRLEATAHGLEAELLTPGWLDTLLSRVASASGEDCPEPYVLAGLALGLEESRAPVGVRKHVGGCPRCARAVRLLRAGALDPRFFVTPPPGLQHTPTVTLVALHFHPAARHHIRDFVAALGSGARLAGADSILVDVDQVPAWDQVVIQRVRMGLPKRDHIRGAVTRAAGRWGARCILGPAPVLALETSRSRPWGDIDGITSLPEPLPPPPSVARWWSSAIAAGLLALAVGLLVLVEGGAHATYAFETEESWDAGGLSVRFDVDDMACLNAYRIGPAGVQVELESLSAADKARFATGEGDFELKVGTGGLVLVSSPEPLVGIQGLVMGSPETASGRSAIRNQVRARYPEADVAVFSAIPPS